MQTTLRTAFITDLLLPSPHSLPTLNPASISQLGYDTALALLHDSESFIRSNPLVTNVRPVTSPSDSKHYIDVPTFCQEFNLSPTGDPSRGISDQWTQYEITDKLNWGLGSSDLIYTTAMRRIPGGFESITSPGSGVRIYGRFEILRPSELGRLATTSHMEQGATPGGAEGGPDSTHSHQQQQQQQQKQHPNAVPAGWDTHPDADGVVHFIEHNETKCNALLGVYIKATNTKSHQAMHENFKRRWGENIKRVLAAEVRVRDAGARSGPGAGAGAGVEQGR
ncbi:uncharacterized protein HMPREF1541_09868 [Cyphellophora europaea CBS 101466]|uniref:DUF7053 domain-containing protein n=1 Tax=Cyphellophora europaea (strain CBS 101466) TaxID=1220924 RepID=W2S8J3_CYPE1|nr:uncharacterized protein HMPREF1541_09868 [Cyphellophora europaea CBS 101466]ETN44992.1 hypothetical protein HMPREF1541_09868 [Cyphellophora europaea CBS 101466]